MRKLRLKRFVGQDSLIMCQVRISNPGRNDSKAKTTHTKDERRTRIVRSRLAQGKNAKSGITIY